MTSLSKNEMRYWLALTRAPAMNIQILETLIYKGSLAKSFQNPNQHLPQPLLQYLRNPPWIIIDKELAWLENSENCTLITWLDKRYPVALRQLAKPPLMLFTQGDVTLLNDPQIAVVGTRKPSSIGEQNARYFGKALAQYFIITSGLAFGVDAICHQHCLAAGGKTIAVLGTGLADIYPKAHIKLAKEIAQQGCLITEFSPFTPPLAKHFPRRNRLISGLSMGVLVIEAAVQSGSLITARFALEQGKEVFAIPGSIHNPMAKGCHRLLREGAKLVESLKDLIEEIAPELMLNGYQSNETSQMIEATPALAEDQQQLLECLAFETLSMDNLSDCLAWPIEKIAKAIIELELLDLVEKRQQGYSRRMAIDTTRQKP